MVFTVQLPTLWDYCAVIYGIYLSLALMLSIRLELIFSNVAIPWFSASILLMTSWKAADASMLMELVSSQSSGLAISAQLGASLTLLEKGG